MIRGEFVLISVVSGSGGTGKSVISACISAHLEKQGKKTIVVDTNGVFSDLDIYLGVEGEFTYNISDVLTKKCDLKDALLKVFEDKNLYFLPSSRHNDVLDFDAADLIDILNELKNTFDCVIVDCDNNKNLIKTIMSVSDMAIVISFQDLLSVRNSDNLISIIEDNDIDIKLLINKYSNEKNVSYYLMSADDMLDKLGINLIGIIPECDELKKLANSSVFSLLESETVLDCVFENISKRILGATVPITKFDKKEKTLKIRFFNKH